MYRNISIWFEEDKDIKFDASVGSTKIVIHIEDKDRSGDVHMFIDPSVVPALVNALVEGTRLYEEKGEKDEEAQATADSKKV